MHDPRYWQYTFHGELTARNTSQPQTQTETFLQQFDADGNVSQRFLLITELSGGYDTDDQVRNYYDAANRLRATQHYLDPSTGVDHGTFDEYEYDALGRRIVVISRRNDSMPACHPSIVLCIQSICNQQATCSSSLTRYAWDGNQTLVEDRLPFGSASYSSDDGYVTYVHGAEIDRPLGVIDTRVSGNLRVPHPTWRGMYESSSAANGSPADCSLTTNTCTLVAWNASNSLYKLDSPTDAHVTTTYTWVGGLLMNQQDATGLTYRRNRYYDPMSGRFSQEDPIGLNGGLNTYGFAGGDPVNFLDPFGTDSVAKKTTVQAGDCNYKTSAGCTAEAKRLIEFEGSGAQSAITAKDVVEVASLVATEGLSEEAVVAERAAVGPATRLVVRAQVALLNSPKAAYAVGFAGGLAKGLFLGGGGNTPTPYFPTQKMTDGYRVGTQTAFWLKAALKVISP